MSRKWVNCPECSVLNREGAALCRMCGAALRALDAEPPRVRRKLLRRTDFMAAARANRAATSRLVLILLTVAAGLGYLVGWNAELWVGDALAHYPDAFFLSRWGITAAAGLVGFGVIWTVVTLRAGDRIVLAVARARRVEVDEEPLLHHVVAEMAIAAGLPKPAVHVVETASLNAFATGMDTRRGAIAVTRGLLDRLDREELQGVIGHEMGHIVNLDTRYATAVGVMVGLVALVSDLALRFLWFGGGSARRRGKGAGVAVVILVLFAALAPLFARLVQMAISRQREFLADATSVRLTRNPHGLIRALEKIGGSAEPFPGANRATQHLFIVNPFRSVAERRRRLFATHPPLEVRITRLHNLGTE